MTAGVSYKNVVTIYDSHDKAECAILELMQEGIDMKNVSIIGRDCHVYEDAACYYWAGDRSRYWGPCAAFWNGVWDVTSGSAYFFVPGIGACIVAGPMAGWIVECLEGASVMWDYTEVGACLGISRRSVFEYEQALKSGKLMVMVLDVETETLRARDILKGVLADSCCEHDLQAAPEILVASAWG